MVQRTLSNILLHLISWIPYSYGNYIHKFCTYLLKSIIKYRKNVIINNLGLAFPDKSSADIAQIANENYQYITAYIWETIQLYAGKDLTKKVTITNVDFLQKSIDQGKSMIVMGSHSGNWEWTSVLLPLFIKADAYAVYKPLANHTLDEQVKTWRGLHGLKLLAMDQVVRHLATCKTPSIYIFIADQRPQNTNTGQWLPFLGVDSLFFEGATVLSKRYKTDLCYQRIISHQGSYSVEYLPLDNEQLSDYVRMLEQDIRRHPAPWLWSHNRWKFRKPNTNNS